MEGSIAELAAAMSKKRIVTVRRDESDDSGTFSLLTTDSGFSCWLGEPPDRNNERGFSCIPLGEYECDMGDTPKHGKAYRVHGVKDRDGVLFHAGNFVGDSRKNLKADSEGCLIPGRAIGAIGGQKALLSSRDALRAFVAEMDGEPFTLRIIRRTL